MNLTGLRTKEATHVIRRSLITRQRLAVKTRKVRTRASITINNEIGN